MTAGKTLAAIIAATLITSLATTASANKATAKDKSETAAKTRVAKAKIDTKKAKAPKAKAPKATTSKAAAKADADAIAIPAVGDTSSIYDDEPWFDQPIAIAKKPKAAKTKGKKAKAPKRSYGGAIGLGNRRAGKAPTVIERETDATPKLNHNAVRKVVRANDASVRYCQTRARRAKQNVGQQVLTFRVDAHGRASNAVVTDIAGKKQTVMSRCMNRQVKGWKLPAGTKGGEISIRLMHRQIGPASAK